MINRPTLSGLTNELLAEFSADHEPPCLSLYQPTHRRHPDNQQDPIRFRNLVKELEASLREKYPTAETQALLEPFEALARDGEFWNYTLEGLAVLGGPGMFRALRIPESVPELVVVANRFHTKPLRRFLQSADRYQVLGLSLDRIRLLEGTRHTLDELDLAEGVPRTIEDALGRELTEPHQTVASYGGSGGPSNPMHHGQGGKSDEADLDAERFFRVVDRAVTEHYSKRSGLPLILAALPEHHDLFHKVSHNPLLAAEGIRTNPDSLSADELRALAWEAVAPRFSARLGSLGEEFAQARSNGVGSDDLVEVAQASTSGRVETLLLEAGRQITGHLDGATGRIALDNESGPHGEDLLDDLGQLVTKQGGAVLVVPAERMPSSTGLAAIYRY
jgi:hypothetical protein